MYPHQYKCSLSFYGLVRLRRDDLCPDGTDQFIQFKQILHSPVGERCMIFELWKLFSSCLSNLSDSLSKPNFFSQFGKRAIVFNLLPDVIQHVYLSLFHGFEDGVLQSTYLWSVVPPSKTGCHPWLLGQPSQSHWMRSPSCIGCTQHTLSLGNCIPMPD